MGGGGGDQEREREIETARWRGGGEININNEISFDSQMIDYEDVTV